MKCPYIKLLWIPSVLLRFFLPSFTNNIFRGGTAYPSRTHGFTPLQCLKESVFFIILLILDLFTNVICVSWFHPLPGFRLGPRYPSFIVRSGVDHQCCLCPLGSPPVFFCSMVLCYTFCIYIYVLSSMLSSQLRFPHENHVWFVFVLSCWSDDIYLFLMVCVCLRIIVSIASWLYVFCVLFVLCVMCLVLPVSLDCRFLIDASVFSNLYLSNFIL